MSKCINLGGHRWVRKGTKDNKTSGWYECIDCHSKKRYKVLKIARRR